MKINKNIPQYIIAENGDVFNRNDGTQVELTDRTAYKLQTVEIFKGIYTKRDSALIRRFTREQIVKLWKDKESLTVKAFEKQENKK